MLNEQKIKKMRKLATYESGKGRKQLRVCCFWCISEAKVII